MFARANSVTVVGIDGFPVDVEVQVAPGLPTFTVVGLPDAAIQESRERVRAAVQASGETWPMKRLTVNLSPAHLPKAGSGFDLAIALAVLAATGRVPQARLREVCAVGELSLDGRVRRVRGVLAAVGAAADRGVRRVLVPRANLAEASLVEGVDVVPLTALSDAVQFLRGTALPTLPPPEPAQPPQPADDADMTDVRGQPLAKRALEVAAAGGHHLLMSGPPGAGKTMLARRLPGILPPLDREEALTVTRLHSVAGLLPDEAGLITRRPFRAPHHSISIAGLVGGGSGIPMPGEVSLAHRGVLFLDEAAEFRRDALQALRQPLEDGIVTIARARVAVTYPSRVQVVLATNPCPCGYAGDEVRSCECPPGRLVAYRQRLSGPLLDRIDLQLDVERVRRADVFADGVEPEPSAVVAERVRIARSRQRERLATLGITTNAEIPAGALATATRMGRDARRAVEDAMKRYELSMRGVHRLIRVARTIADLEGAGPLETGHIGEAVRLRLRS